MSHHLQRSIWQCSEGPITSKLRQQLYYAIQNLWQDFGAILNTLGRFMSHFYFKISHVKMAPILPYLILQTFGRCYHVYLTLLVPTVVPDMVGVEKRAGFEPLLQQWIILVKMALSEPQNDQFIQFFRVRLEKSSLLV